MQIKSTVDTDELVEADIPSGADLLLPLVAGLPVRSAPPGTDTGVVVGELIAFADNGVTPLVVYPGQPGSAAVGARSVVDLHASHIGSQVVLMFDRADPVKPIVMGVVRNGGASALESKPPAVEVDADGARLVVNASEQLVLRCGNASITLTKSGKVLIQGTYVSSRSTGVNRVKGGSVQLN